MQIFTEIVHFVIFLLHILVTVVMLLGIVMSLKSFICLHLHTKKYIDAVKQKNFNHYFDLLKKKLGLYILYGLELLIIVDILESILEPSMENLFRVGIIVIIRTFLAYFLEREISHIRDDND